MSATYGPWSHVVLFRVKKKVIRHFRGKLSYDDLDRVADPLGQLLARLNGHGIHGIHGPHHHLFSFCSPLHPRGV